jgi:hypothetical protein
VIESRDAEDVHDSNVYSARRAGEEGEAGGATAVRRTRAR